MATAKKSSSKKSEQTKVSQASNVARGQLAGFIEFVREKGVVGLAVGLAIGLQATELTKAIVGSVITPVIDLLVGEGGLNGLEWTLQLGNRAGTFDFGTLIDELIKFLAVAFVIYYVIHGLKLDKLDKKKE